MVRITEELVRKKSEHNELMISTLEELSLHQEDIEKIENLQNWCRDLKILLLQSNLISKIENLHKLKKLEYLNLAINCIERIENLEKLESLNKLDLTLNFIGELTSIENLKNNYNLKNLILTGNPCTEFKGYRDYVITILPQLQYLDNIEIKLSDKLNAKHYFQENRRNIIQNEIEYKIQRDEQKIRVNKQKLDFEKQLNQLNDDEERSKLFWNSKSENCPETRYDIAKEHRRTKKLDDNKPKEKFKKIPKLFAPCGRPYNLNQPKLQFRMNDEPEYYELDLHVYKYLETSLIHVDAQPNYVRVTVKDKIFQVAFNQEINISESTTKRSQITGHLLIHMPKLIVQDGYLVQKKNNSNSGEKNKSNEKNDGYLKGTVNYKNIVNKPIREKLSTTIQESDEIEIPALI